MTTTVASKRKWANIATITLIVGASKTAFQIHEAELSNQSPFFRAALGSNAQEDGSERSMTLAEDEAEVFDSFAEWLYSRSVEVPAAPADGRFAMVVKLYGMAHKYGVRDLKDAIMEKIDAACRAPEPEPLTTVVAYAYAHTVQGSGMRKMVADYYAFRARHRWYEEDGFRAWLRGQPDFSADLNVSFARLKSGVYIAGSSNPFYGDDGMPEKFKEPKGIGS